MKDKKLKGKIQKGENIRDSHLKCIKGSYRLIEIAVFRCHGNAKFLRKFLNVYP